MVSHINVDMTGIGDQIAAAVTEALKRIDIKQGPSHTPKELGEEIGEAVGKHVAAALQNSVQELQDTPSLDVTALREQILANVKLIYQLEHTGVLPDFVLAVSNTDDSYVAEITQCVYHPKEPMHMLSGAYNSLKPYTRPARKTMECFMQGGLSDFDTGALQALHSESMWQLGQIRERVKGVNDEFASEIALRDAIMNVRWVPRNLSKYPEMANAGKAGIIIFHEDGETLRTAALHYGASFKEGPNGGIRDGTTGVIFVQGDKADTNHEALENLYKSVQAEGQKYVTKKKQQPGW